MKKNETNILLLEKGCRTLERQCIMLEDTIRKQELLIQNQEDMIQILKEEKKHLKEHLDTLSRAYHVQEKLCLEQENIIRQMMEQNQE